MELLVDLHLHSRYARATSKDMTLPSLYRWGKLKGISILGTGDFTHPEWFAQLQAQLEPAEPGLFQLKSELAAVEDQAIPASCQQNVHRFVLTVEISTIYSRHGKLRKVHSVVVVPDFQTAATLNHRLSTIGNLAADGRPILGLDTAELLQLVHEVNPESVFIPAHVWTPWFGVFGSKSGFDSLTAAFGELAKYVPALETGLSSDPVMNRRLSQHDNKAIVSFSDAHSPQKLGREATIIDAELSYAAIMGAITTNDERLVGTIEFFPEEGKYHYDGHRACGVVCSPVETKRRQGVCPVCGKQLTIGVEYRVEELADREVTSVPHDSSGHTSIQDKTVEYIIPLVEILAQLKHLKSTASKSVQAEYHQVIAALGTEFSILRTVPVAQIRAAGWYDLATAIEHMRAGTVIRTPGYDGVYGSITVPLSSGTLF